VRRARPDRARFFPSITCCAQLQRELLRAALRRASRDITRPHRTATLMPIRSRTFGARPQSRGRTRPNAAKAAWLHPRA
jgi:hypothetical protein